MQMEFPKTYQVEWIPTAAIEALPSPDKSDVDGWDAASKYALAKTFAGALALAKKKLPEDWFGCVRIAHLVKIQSRYIQDGWDVDAVWHYSGEGGLLHEDAPEYRPDDEQTVYLDPTH